MTEVLLALVLMSGDVYSLGQCIQGEMGPFFPDNRDVVGAWIGHTMMNRVESPWFPNDTRSAVEEGCHGYVNVTHPDPWALALALRSLNGEDVTNGCFFFLSETDLKNHGWSSEKSVREFTGRDVSFHFFREWVE